MVIGAIRAGWILSHWYSAPVTLISRASRNRNIDRGCCGPNRDLRTEPEHRQSAFSEANHPQDQVQGPKPLQGNAAAGKYPDAPQEPLGSPRESSVQSLSAIGDQMRTVQQPKNRGDAAAGSLTVNQDAVVSALRSPSTVSASGLGGPKSTPRTAA